MSVLPTPTPDAVREFIVRVAAGPCWANRGGMTECKDAFLPKGERHPREFCLRCHAQYALAVLAGQGVCIPRLPQPDEGQTE